jgi:hypothetical protein
MMDLSEVIFDPDWHQVVEIDRRAGAYDAGGRWIESYTRGELDAAVHPAPPDAMQSAPEGERHLPGIKVYSVQEVGFGDLIYWGGDTWRVFGRGNWSQYGFFDSTAVRHLGTTAPGGAAFNLA